jgi:hypothetical protein
VNDTLKENNKIVLRLSDCGTKILVEEPSVPHFFHTHVNGILEGIKDIETRRAIQVAHNYKMNEICDKPEQATQKYILNLPPGKKCKMGFMNPSSGRVLVGSMNVSNQKVTFPGAPGLEFEFTMPTITYAIAIDDGSQKVVTKNPAIGNEGLDYFARMSTRF